MKIELSNYYLASVYRRDADGFRVTMHFFSKDRTKPINQPREYIFKYKSSNTIKEQIDYVLMLVKGDYRDLTEDDLNIVSKELTNIVLPYGDNYFSRQVMGQFVNTKYYNDSNLLVALGVIRMSPDELLSYCNTLDIAANKTTTHLSFKLDHVKNRNPFELLRFDNGVICDLKEKYDDLGIYGMGKELNYYLNDPDPSLNDNDKDWSCLYPNNYIRFTFLYENNEMKVFLMRVGHVLFTIFRYCDYNTPEYQYGHIETTYEQSIKYGFSRSMLLTEKTIAANNVVEKYTKNMTEDEKEKTITLLFTSLNKEILPDV